MERPTWDEYFTNFAVLTSTRSPDSQTKVGCVLVHENRVISAGYNGFCSGVDDSSLPTHRPDKYPFMVHAEQNAVSNMVIKPRKNITAYITHMPCYRCAKLLWQNNITAWKIANGNKVSSYSDQDTMIHNHLIDFGLQIEWVSPSRSYLNELTNNNQNEKQARLF